MEVKERPIIFSGPMVRAILEGRKTQTRRAMKPQPEFTDDANFLYGDGHSGTGWYCYCGEYPDEGSAFYRCPYGEVGERLWVRETFYCDDYRYPSGPLDVLKKVIYYRADPDVLDQFEAEKPVWKPSIYMPRWASRITLEITDVRVERVQDINHNDCLAEGIETPPLPDDTSFENEQTWLRMQYHELWNSINAKRGFAWDTNPLVWVIEFKRVKCPT